MPRTSRINIPGGVYHIITRGIERKDIFKDDNDRYEFLIRLETNLKHTNSKCYAWVLMSNHLHLMIRAGADGISAMMRRLLTGYAIYFNRKHKRGGHLYQNRYKSILCQEDIYFQELARYIHLNPIRAGIVSGMNELGKYRWSGHSAIIGKCKNQWQDSGEVLLYYGSQKGKAIAAYREFIKNGINKKPITDFEAGRLLRSVVGWTGVSKLKKEKQSRQGDERILGDVSFINQVMAEAEERIDRQYKLKSEGWDIDKVIQSVCGFFGINRSLLLKKGRNNILSEAKEAICYITNKELGISATEIGFSLGISQPTVSK